MFLAWRNIGKIRQGKQKHYDLDETSAKEYGKFYGDYEISVGEVANNILDGSYEYVSQLRK